MGLRWFAVSCSHLCLCTVVELEGSAMTNGIRKLSLLLGFARVAIWLVLVLMTIPAVARVSAKKPAPPPPSTGSSFATAYSVPYSTSVAESISQASSGGFVVGGLCSETAGTTPNCNGYATVLSVDSSGNIQSQTQYSYGNVKQSTALNVLKATSDGGAIFAGQPQFGCPALNLSSCG